MTPTKPSHFHGIERKVVVAVAALSAITYMGLGFWLEANRDGDFVRPVNSAVVLVSCVALAASALLNRWFAIAAAMVVAFTASIAAVGPYGLIIWLSLRVGRTTREMREAGTLPPPKWIQRREAKAAAKSTAKTSEAAAGSAAPPRPSKKNKRYTPPRATAGRR